MGAFTYRDRVGLYPVCVLYVALGVQALIYGERNHSTLLILLSIVASLAPFWFPLPANWRGALTDRMGARLPLMGAVAPALMAFLQAFMNVNLNIEPRTGYLVAAAGLVNFATFLLLARPTKISSPSKWSWIAFAVGLSTGFITVLIELDIVMNYAAALMYGLYGFMSHVLIRSIIDRPVEKPPDSGSTETERPRV